MPSPFRGMNPYLEAPTIWEYFHANLATEIRSQLAPQLRPRYIAVLTPHVVYEELAIQETYLIKPDVGVLQIDQRSGSGEATMIASAPLTGRTAMEVPIKSQSIEIRQAQTGQLITAIEILSPINKRPGHEAFDAYQRKRRDLLRTSVHLLEIDLLRGGRHPALETPLPSSPYFVFLSRAERRPLVDIWPLEIQTHIPMLPIPVLAPDPDVPLDLGRAIATIYDEAAYDLRVDYTQAPPKPDLSSEDQLLLDTHLRSLGLR